jgi:hypothetical protein
MKSLFIFILSLSSLLTSAQEFVGPFNSWVQIHPGDDIQAAFNKIKAQNRPSTVVYVNPGVYSITATLHMDFAMNVSIIGADPATTIFQWNGEPNDTMLTMNGTAYSKLNRITFDGQNIAVLAVDQSWDGNYNNGYFDTGNEYADDVFKGVQAGVVGGQRGHGFAETSFVRCKFIKCGVAGAILGNFNALDIWFWNCLFDNCATGVTNEYGAGNFKIYNCVFRNSTVTDLKFRNTGEFSFRDNTSTGSNMFLDATFTANPSCITLQNNTIIDPIQTTCIRVSNQGPVSFYDNTIRSKQAGIVVSHQSWPGGNANFFAIGNKFNFPNHYQLTTSYIFDDKVEPNLSGLAEQALEPTPQNQNRPVFEIPLGSNESTIQSIVNQAMLLKGKRPIVHFPYGTYVANIIVGNDVQIVGDGYGDRWPTLINGKVVLNGTASLQDISIKNGGVVVNNNSTKMNHVMSVGNDVNVLAYSDISMYNSGVGSAKQKSIVVNGGHFLLFGSAQSDNALVTCEINGGQVMIRDAWYETSKANQYLNLIDGRFILEGGHVYNSIAPPLQFVINGGKATLLTTEINGNVNSIGETLAMSTFVFYLNHYTGNYVYYNGRVLDPNANTTGTGSNNAPDVGPTLTQAKIESHMLEARQTHTPSFTDFQLYRVWISNAPVGITAGSDFRPLPITFTSFTADCVNGKTLLSWGATGDYTKFGIERNGRVVATTTDKSFVIGGVGVFRVIAYNKDGSSTSSNYISSKCIATLKMFPNPTTGVIYVRSANGLITVTTMNGTILKKIRGVGLIPVDLTPYAAGTYIIKVDNISQKVVKVN